MPHEYFFSLHIYIFDQQEVERRDKTPPLQRTHLNSSLAQVSARHHRALSLFPLTGSDGF